MAKAQVNKDDGVVTLPKGWAFDADGIARSLKNGWVFDYEGLARRIFSAETPLTISYTGTYTDEVVQMTDGTYRLLTLTGSGTLTFNQATVCDIWACGGGGSGGRYYSSQGGGGGGGGGYCSKQLSQKISHLVVEIGAGGVGSTSANKIVAGGATSISGDVVLSADGAATVAGAQIGGPGGSGGGSGGGRYSGKDAGAAWGPGLGGGVSTIPFEDAYFQPLCAGGGGGGCNQGEDYFGNGGAGGTNGGNGISGDSKNNGRAGGTGGILGGGTGGAAAADNTAIGGNATNYGGGGGGGAYKKGNTGATIIGGSGYQGCVMVRIKLSA